MNTIWTRLTSESPTFFKRIQAIAITIGTIGVGILAVPVTLSPFGIVYVLPASISVLASHMAAAGAVAALVAKSTVADPTVLNTGVPKMENPPVPPTDTKK